LRRNKAFNVIPAVEDDPAFGIKNGKRARAVAQDDINIAITICVAADPSTYLCRSSDLI